MQTNIVSKNKIMFLKIYLIFHLEVKIWIL